MRKAKEHTKRGRIPVVNPEKTPLIKVYVRINFYNTYSNTTVELVHLRCYNT